MHESHPGVQDMACDTFLKIADKCKRKFVTLQTEESVPFLCELVDSLPSIISDLEPHQVQAFYEATATMLSDRGPAISIDRQVLLHKLMDLPNRTWKVIMDHASMNVETLLEPNTIKEIIKILKNRKKINIFRLIFISLSQHKSNKFLYFYIFSHIFIKTYSSSKKSFYANLNTPFKRGSHIK